MWDNMKKNGFTLVELLVVIILLGLIVTLFIPNVIKILKQNNTKIYKIKENDNSFYSKKNQNLKAKTRKVYNFVRA